MPHPPWLAEYLAMIAAVVHRIAARCQRHLSIQYHQDIAAVLAPMIALWVATALLAPWYVPTVLAGIGIIIIYKICTLIGEYHYRTPVPPPNYSDIVVTVMLYLYIFIGLWYSVIGVWTGMVAKFGSPAKALMDMIVVVVVVGVSVGILYFLRKGIAYVLRKLGWKER